MGVALVSAISLALIASAERGDEVEVELPSPKISLHVSERDEVLPFDWVGVSDASKVYVNGELAEPLLSVVPEDVGLADFHVGAGDVFDPERWEGRGVGGARLEAVGSLESSSAVSFRYERPLMLNTGGIDVSGEAFRDLNGQAWVPAVVEAGAGEFELHDVGFEWSAVRSGSFSWLLTSGVRAIRAELDAVDASLADPRGVVAVPLIGTGVRWSMPNEFHISGIAETQTVSTDASVVDLRAEAGIDFTPNVGFAAGYQYLRSTFEVESIGAEIRQEGPFARFQIRF